MAFTLSPWLLAALAAATGRDSRDIGSLLQPHHSYLMALLRFKCRKEDLAEELLQETYLAFLSSGAAEKNFGSPDKLRNYLITIALNKFRDWLRRNRTAARHVKTFRTREDLDLALESLTGREGDPGEVLAEEDQRQHLAACVNLTLEGLPPRQKQVLLLKFRQEDLDNQTLARELGLEIKALESLVFRAKESFRKNFIRLSREYSLEWRTFPGGEAKGFSPQDVYIRKEAP